MLGYRRISVLLLVRYLGDVSLPSTRLLLWVETNLLIGRSLTTSIRRPAWTMLPPAAARRSLSKLSLLATAWQLCSYVLAMIRNKEMINVEPLEVEGPCLCRSIQRPGSYYLFSDTSKLCKDQVRCGGMWFRLWGRILVESASIWS